MLIQIINDDIFKRSLKISIKWIIVKQSQHIHWHVGPFNILYRVYICLFFIFLPNIKNSHACPRFVVAALSGKPKLKSTRWDSIFLIIYHNFARTLVVVSRTYKNSLKCQKPNDSFTNYFINKNKLYVLELYKK